MYVDPNYKTKKELREAIAHGHEVTVFQPNDMFSTQPPHNGCVTVEGPHYPAPHKWYAGLKIENGKVVRMLS